MPQFAILHHNHPHIHWDLLLEKEASLRTWRLEAVPEPGIVIAAVALADHRLMYLDYEGPVSGNRGVVTRWDRGDYDILTETETELWCEFRGIRLRGPVELIRNGDQWRFCWRQIV